MAPTGGRAEGGRESGPGPVAAGQSGRGKRPDRWFPRLHPRRCWRWRLFRADIGSRLCCRGATLNGTDQDGYAQAAGG
jgi:hypothetical protein